MQHERPVILIVDDEPSIVSSIIRSLEDDYECLGAGDAAQARELFASGKPITCVVSDQRMPGEQGSDFLGWVSSHHPHTVRILITGYADFDSVVAAVNRGHIWQFIQKPWEPLQLEMVVRQAVERHRLEDENRRLHEELQQRNQKLERENLDLRRGAVGESGLFPNLVGLSEPMQRLRQRLTHLLPSLSTVLITGESGTGKELVARALHSQGARGGKPFIAQNCAALPDSILESELFGHVKGSFTHATQDRVGILESAHLGTLFLDEVGDMTLAMQAKLLRFLQEGTFTPVGSRQEKKVDVRVIAATHRDLETMVRDNTFRQDLFYRLNVVPLRTPALRERREDIPLLVEHFLRKKGERLGKPGVSLDPDAMETAKAYSWPGNVRELENAIEYALNMLGDRSRIQSCDLPDRLLALGAKPETWQTSPASETSVTAETIVSGPELAKEMQLDQAVMALETAWINRAMQACAGNISQAARVLGLSRQGLHNKLAKYGIKS